MKKYLILGILALTTMSFAWGGHDRNWREGNYNGRSRSCCNSWFNF